MSLVLARGDHALVFGLDDLGAPGRLLHIGKAQLQQGRTDAVQPPHAKVSNEGGGQTDDHRPTGGDQGLCLGRYPGGSPWHSADR